jgi:hypothetical protein
MADVKISALPAASTPLTGGEVLPIVQSGTTTKVAVSNLTAGLAGTASININGTVGATTPTTGAFTSGTFSTTLGVTGTSTLAAVNASGKITSTVGNNGIVLENLSATTGYQYLRLVSTGASGLIGIDSSVGGVLGTGTTAYSMVLSTQNATSLHLVSNSVVGLTLASGGAVTIPGTLGVTGLITASANGKFLLANGATTGQLIPDLENSGGRLVFGIANSAGTAPLNLGTAYAVCLNSDSGTPIELAVSSTTRLKIVSGGVVTMSAYGAGTATFSSAGVISSVSDETWKTKDGIPTNPDAMLQKLAPGYWYYNDEKKETFGSERQLGFYAQNVNAAIGPEAAPEPETVVTKNKDGTETSVTKPWGYYDRSVLAVTVMSLQKALSTIEQLTAKVAALEAK